MSAYTVVQLDITEPGRYEDDKGMVKSMLDQNGGRFFVRGAAENILVEGA